MISTVEHTEAKKNVVFVKWHLGLGDAFVFAGRIRSDLGFSPVMMADRSFPRTQIVIPVKAQNARSVRSLFFDLDKSITYVVVRNAEQMLEKAAEFEEISKDKNFLVWDYTARGNPMTFVNERWDYSLFVNEDTFWNARYQFALPRWEDPKVTEESEEIIKKLNRDFPRCSVFQEEGTGAIFGAQTIPVFVHEDPDRGKAIPKPDLAEFKEPRYQIIRPWRSDSILAWERVLERCPVVLTVDSAFANLVESLKHCPWQLRKCFVQASPPPTLRLGTQLDFSRVGCWMPEDPRGYYLRRRHYHFRSFGI